MIWCWLSTSPQSVRKRQYIYVTAPPSKRVSLGIVFLVQHFPRAPRFPSFVGDQMQISWAEVESACWFGMIWPRDDVGRVWTVRCEGRPKDEGEGGRCLQELHGHQGLETEQSSGLFGVYDWCFISAVLSSAKTIGWRLLEFPLCRSGGFFGNHSFYLHDNDTNRLFRNQA